MGNNAMRRVPSFQRFLMRQRFPMSPMRLRLWRLSALAVTMAVPALCAAALQPTSQSQEREFLSRIRRLTVEGRRSGEGYWSPDGRRLVFQSEREQGNPFYQIYVMDLSSGDVKRISTGVGKTTCSFFRPHSDEILFSSTHADPK